MPVPMQATMATPAVSVPRSFDEAYRSHAQDAARWARHLGGWQIDVDKLPEKYRTVLVLFEIEGLSTHDIAELCYLRWPTVKVQLHRTRELFLQQHEQLTKKGSHDRPGEVGRTLGRQDGAHHGRGRAALRPPT